MCWADSTWVTRKSQWRRYINFCDLYDFKPLPATIDMICLYITYLTDQVKYSTICNYLSAVWSLHEHFGYAPSARNTFLVRCTLRGARRLLGDSVLTADPLMPEDLMKLYRFMNKKSLFDLLFWCALCLGYRCLLRKSHFTYSNHTLLYSDVKFTEYGMHITLRSSKTIQYSERIVEIPVIESKGSILCPVHWLRLYLRYVKVPIDGPLFVIPGTLKPLTYRAFSDRLKAAIRASGLTGRFTSHSLRRGCATYLSRLGLPLHDIKVYGDWRSLSVLLYLSGDIHTRLVKDKQVAKSFEVYSRVQ